MSTDKNITQNTENNTSDESNAIARNKLKEKNIVEKVAEAHEQAEADIEKDPELSFHDAEDDLDEGEAARLGKE